MKCGHGSDSNVVFGFFGAAHDIVDHFVEAVVLVVQGLVLEFEVFELFVLVIAVALEQLREVVDSLTYLLMQFLKLGLGTLLQLLQLHLKLALLLSLVLQRFLEVVHRHLNHRQHTSMSSTCSLTVVVKPSLESVLPASDIIRSFRLLPVLITIKLYQITMLSFGNLSTLANLLQLSCHKSMATKFKPRIYRCFV